VDAPAVTFLGLIRAFDRASVPEAHLGTGDTGPITSSRARCALRYPQVGVIVRGRKQAGQRTKTSSQYELQHKVPLILTSKQHLVTQHRFHISGSTG
jgi:hypothetical protein